MAEISTGILTAWVIGLAGAGLAVVAGHLAITKLYPALKSLLSTVIKEEKAVDGVLSLLVGYTLIFVLREALKALLAINNEYLNVIALLNPPITLLIDILWYISWLVLAFFFVYGLKKK